MSEPRRFPPPTNCTQSRQWQNHPWTMGWQPSYRIESRIYARYILKTQPDAKIAVLYQNDDFGRDYLIGLRDGLGDKANQLIVASQSSVIISRARTCCNKRPASTI